MPFSVRFESCNIPVCRLGLATRGNTHLNPEDIWLALERGINYWNWCGHKDGMSQAIRESGPLRRTVVVATQLSARDNEGARRELERRLEVLKTSYVDVITFYYVETDEEWNEIIGSGGALEAIARAREEGLLRMIGLTTHQRALANRILASRLLDLLMVRYNAAHRGAEREIFMQAQQINFPLVTFTGLRWKALLHSTREDPETFVPPPAREWYRFVLAHPAVSVALMAPNNRPELLENLKLLKDWRLPTPEEYKTLCQHGDRVHRHAGKFL